MKICPQCDTEHPSHHSICPTDGAVLIEVRSWEPGTIVKGKYRILALVGRGGMGIVYKAEHIGLEEVRALKVMSSTLCGDPAFAQRFRREAQAARKLHHANAVHVDDLDQAEDGSLFIAMDYVDGGTLGKLLDSTAGPLSIERALDIARGIAEGLAAAHALGMVHRDIKPDNIVLARDRHGRDMPKILDFGIVAMKESSNTRITRGPLLTPDYAPPEQWRGTPASELDGRADLYALGCVLYEMLTGQTPFHAHNYEGWMFQHLTETPTPPSALQPELAQMPGLDALVLKLLAKDREARPASAEAFLDELSRLKSSPATPAVKPPAPTVEARRQTEVETAAPASQEPESAEEQYQLGFNYLLGAGVRQDDAQAERLFRASAERGNPRGQRGLGFLYEHGRGVRQDSAAAISWYRKAAELGDNEAQEGLNRLLRTSRPKPAEAAPASTPAPAPAPLRIPVQPGARPKVPLAGPDEAEQLYQLGVKAKNGDGVEDDKAEAVRLFRLAAERGHADAQNELATCLYEGNGVERNHPEALRWFRMAAEQGCAQAQFMLGVYYQNGEGVAKDSVEAMRWYQMTAAQGNAMAQYMLGFVHASGMGVARDDAEAARWYRKAAEQGNAQAQFALGSLIWSGRGGAKDPAEAVRWIRKAAEQGNAIAQYNLALLCEQGRGVEKNDAEAARLFRTAAESGNSDARDSLARRLRTGAGSPQDNAEVVRWFLKAAEKGDSTAQFYLGVMYAHGHGVQQDETEAVRWYLKAANQGNRTAQYNLGDIYANGRGVKRDRVEAIWWYRKAAEQGFDKAQAALGDLLFNGKGEDQDRSQALEWYIMAAKQGHTGAQFWLGQMHAGAKWVKRDFAEAVRWYRMAAEGGHAQAQTNLAIACESGLGMEEADPAAAAYWYEKAAAQNVPIAGLVNPEKSLHRLLKKGVTPRKP